MADNSISVKRAFVSVSDRTGLVPFARFLAERNVELYATGGTASFLQENGVPVRPAQELTGVVEILSGKVKSLSPRLHAAILFDRSKPEECAHMEKEGVPSIDMVVVNFYPFQNVTPEHTLSEAVSLIDIGGPASIRAAAKNSRWVVPVPEPGAYGKVMEDILGWERAQEDGRKGAVGETTGSQGLDGSGESGANGAKSGTDTPPCHKDTAAGVRESHRVSGELAARVSVELSAQLAARVFEITSAYDRLVMGYLRDKSASAVARVPVPPQTALGVLPESIDLKYKRAQTLRYGENPHQKATFYVEPDEVATDEERGGLPLGRQLQGKELSFNNLLDLDAAVSACREFDEPACVVIKHRNPSGVSVSKDVLTAYRLARDCDPLSVFGGVVAVNREVTAELATEMSSLFLEVIAAPGFDTAAVQAFAKKKNLRLLELPAGLFGRPTAPRLILRSGLVGVLVEEEDSHPENPGDWKVVSRRTPTPEELAGLFFLWRVVRHTISNAIVLGRSDTTGKGDRTLGIGAGQTSRVDSVEMALHKAKRSGHDVTGAWLASDAFFPFRDSIDVAAKAGIEAIVEPGGSVRDAECVQAADEHDIVLCFTGRRCFRH